MTTPQNCVLVVDDSPTSLSLLFQTLRQAYYRVFVVQGGAEALSQIDGIRPDIILLDIDMPGMDGFETCRRLKANPHTANIPVIFMTASDQTEDKVRGFDVGGVDYITKPAEPSELLARINTHLTLRNLQRELEFRQARLEADVEARTAHLQSEISRRELHQVEKEQLLELTAAQGDLAHNLLLTFIAGQDDAPEPSLDLLYQQVLPGLAQLKEQLAALRQTAEESARSEAILHQAEAALQTLLRVQQQAQEAAARLTVTLTLPLSVTHELLDKLSERELDVLRLTAQGQETAQIAETLFLSENTVRVYRSRLMQKLELENLPALVKFALKHQLISLE